MTDNFKTTIIVNPASASGQTSVRWPVLQNLLEQESFVFDVASTTGPGTATDLARKAIHQGYEMVVAMGGDGTINEVANGFFENGKPINPEAVLGILCVGTGGDRQRKSVAVAETAARSAIVEEYFGILVGRRKGRIGQVGDELGADRARGHEEFLPRGFAGRGKREAVDRSEQAVAS